jgi:peptidoglycan/xylan/chitin deacetylase (PgdA/CDA1 family)
MQKLIYRHDDFDFRLDPNQYIAIHEKFIEAGLIETAVLQFTQDNRLVNVPEELIKYIKESPNWDLAIHGWAHHHYDELKMDIVIRDIAAAMRLCEQHFGVTPKRWHTPWNCISREMEIAANYLGLEISNESYDIARFIREVKTGGYSGHSMYFHGWKSDEMLLFPEMLELAKKYETAAV